VCGGSVDGQAQAREIAHVVRGYLAHVEDETHHEEETP